MQARLLRPERRIQSTRPLNARARSRCNVHDYLRMISAVRLLLLTTIMMTTMTTIMAISMMIVAILFAMNTS